MWILLLLPLFCWSFIPNTWMYRDPESKESKKPTLHSCFSISWQASLLMWREDRGADCQRTTSSTTGIKCRPDWVRSNEVSPLPMPISDHREMVPQVTSEQPTDDAVEGERKPWHLFPCCPLRFETWTILSRSTCGTLLAVWEKRPKITSRWY